VNRAALDAWCATVGTPAIDTTGAIPRSAPPDSFAIVAWNVHVGGGNLDRFVQDLREGRLTNGRQVENFVLLIQEALRTSDSLPPVRPDEVPDRIVAFDQRDSTRTDIVEAARRLGLAYIYVPSMRNGTADEDRGNAILSTIPLRHALAIELPLERQRRVTVAASIEVADTTFAVVSVHLENVSSDLLMSFGSGRLRQAAALMRVLRRNTPTIIGGDLNTWFAESGEPALRFMREYFPRSPDVEIGATHRGYGRTTDHLFFRLPPGWRASYGRVNDAYGSDHYPVLGFVWRDAATRGRATQPEPAAPSPR